MEFKYTILTEKTCAITNVRGLEPGIMEIPSIITDVVGNDYRVVSVCCEPEYGGSYEETIEDKTVIRKVIIPEGVTEIADNAFFRYLRLNTAILPSTLESIGEWAFCDCWLKRGITLPENLKELGDCAFEHCRELKEIVIPEGVTTIPYRAFHRCGKLQKVVLPSTLTTIKAYAFAECGSLEDLEIPASVTTIEQAAFCGDFNIKLQLPSGLDVNMEKLLNPEWIDKA